MRIATGAVVNVVWSLPVRGESPDSSRGDLVRARSLIEAMREEGHRVVVVADQEAPAARTRVASYRRLVRPFFPVPIAGAVRDLGRVAHGWAHGRRVAAVARREGADLIVETQVHFAGSGSLASRLSGVPLVLDDCSPWTEERKLGAGLPRLARRVLQAQARRAVALTAPTRQIRDRLVEGGAPPARVHVVPNGVDVRRFVEADRVRARRHFGFSDEVVVAFVGSFQPWHRAELLLEALERTSGVRLHLLLVGAGPGLDRVRTRVEELGLGDRVTVPGPLHGAELAAALVASDIGALPASNEYGQPMKLLDYAAAGLAIVAVDVPPVREMVRVGVTGLLVPEEDPDALASALGTLAGFPVVRARLGKAARELLAIPASWREGAHALLRSAGVPAATIHGPGARTDGPLRQSAADGAVRAPKRVERSSRGRGPDPRFLTLRR